MHWLTVVQDNFEHDGRTIPRGALVVYREWYGASAPNVGLKLTAEEVAAGIVARETDRDGRREHVSYGVLDPSAFAVQFGPSIAETLMRHGAVFRRADNTRSSSISHDRRKGGWDQLRARLKGDGDGRPPIYFFSHAATSSERRRFSNTTPTMPKTSTRTVTTIPGDSVRYACLSCPYRAHEPVEDVTALLAIPCRECVSPERTGGLTMRQDVPARGSAGDFEAGGRYRRADGGLARALQLPSDGPEVEKIMELVKKRDALREWLPEPHRRAALRSGTPKSGLRDRTRGTDPGCPRQLRLRLQAHAQDAIRSVLVFPDHGGGSKTNRQP